MWGVRAILLWVAIFATASGAVSGTAVAAVDSQSLMGLATNGTINEVQEVGGRLYVGGVFTAAGRETGPASLLDETTGYAVAGLPRISGVVLDLEPDGAGGWYVAGAFDRIGRDERHNIAHVLSDGTVDAAFLAGPDSGQTVNDVELVESRLLVAGSFSDIGGAARTGLAELDATGRATTWDPRATGAVHVLRVDGDRLYVGGLFDRIGGEPRPWLAALRISDLGVTTRAPAAGPAPASSTPSSPAGATRSCLRRPSGSSPPPSRGCA